MDSSVPIFTGANVSTHMLASGTTVPTGIDEQNIISVPAVTEEPIITYSPSVTDTTMTISKPVGTDDEKLVAESTNAAPLEGRTGFLSTTSKTVATKESVSPNKKEVELPKVETELPTEPGLELPNLIIKSLVNGGNSKKESTTISPTLEEDMSSTHALPKATKVNSVKNGKNILTNVPSEGNLTNSVGMEKTLVPFEPETENINGKQIAVGRKETVQKPDQNNVEPSKSPSKSSKPSATVPNAVPLVTDDSGFDNFWWFF